MSYNAVLRILAHLPFEAETAHTNADFGLRDDALPLALHTLDRVLHSNIVHANTATFVYMLHILDKYLPNSPHKGDILHGMYRQALYANVVDDGLLETYRNIVQNNTNGPEYISWIQEHLPTNDAQVHVRQRFRRYAKLYRYHAREATY